MEAIFRFIESFISSNLTVNPHISLFRRPCSFLLFYVTTAIWAWVPWVLTTRPIFLHKNIASSFWFPIFLEPRPILVQYWILAQLCILFILRPRTCIFLIPQWQQVCGPRRVDVLWEQSLHNSGSSFRSISLLLNSSAASESSRSWTQIWTFAIVITHLPQLYL